VVAGVLGLVFDNICFSADETHAIYPPLQIFKEFCLDDERGPQEFCNSLSNSNPAVRPLHKASRRTEGVKNMAKLVFGLQQSLDGYVDHLEMGPPGPALSRHFVEHVRDLAGCVYGRRT
jgi:hypothetical protein